eukprot:1926241-Pyramimonas_sp.AAC.1
MSISQHSVLWPPDNVSQRSQDMHELQRASEACEAAEPDPHTDATGSKGERTPTQAPQDDASRQRRRTSPPEGRRALTRPCPRGYRQ